MALSWLIQRESLRRTAFVSRLGWRSRQSSSPYLAGGTGLALQIGHRVSVDFDWFSGTHPLMGADRIRLLAALRASVPAGEDVSVVREEDGTLAVRVAGVDVSFFTYPYPVLAPPSVLLGLPLASLADIAAMKLSAIIGRGSRKDFIDLNALLHEHPLGCMAQCRRSQVHPGKRLSGCRAACPRLLRRRRRGGAVADVDSGGLDAAEVRFGGYGKGDHAARCWPWAGIGLRRRPPTHRLGNAHRLAIVDALRHSDRAPVVLAATLGIGSNLLAHHLSALEAADLITRVVSHGDGRRRYVRLFEETLAGLMPPPRLHARRVLFVCRHNAARSQLAAALWRERSTVPVNSAGSEPAARVHREALYVARRHALDLDNAHPRGYDEVEEMPELVISVCDVAAEAGPPYPDATRLHWSVPDPTEDGSEAAFELVFHVLRSRVEAVAPFVEVP